VTAFMSDIFPRLLEGSVLNFLDHNMANLTCAQGPARDGGERIAFDRCANLEQVAQGVGTAESSSHQRVPDATAAKTAYLRPYLTV